MLREKQMREEALQEKKDMERALLQMKEEVRAAQEALVSVLARNFCLTVKKQFAFVKPQKSQKVETQLYR